MKSVKLKLILGGCFLSALSLAIAIGISYFISHGILLDTSKQKSVETAKMYAEQLNGWMTSQGKMVSEMVNDMQIINNYDGKYLLNYFAQKQKENPQIICYYIGFADKKVVFGDGWVADADYDCTTRPWYVEAVKKNGLVYTSPYLDPSSKKMVVTVARPVMENGKVFGVLAADIYVDYLTTVTANAKAGEGSYAMLLDSDKNIIVHINKDFQPTTDKMISYKDAGKGIYKDLNIVSEGKPAIMIHKDYDNQDKWFAIAPISSCGWTFGVVIPTKVFNSPLNKLILGFCGAAAITLIITVIFSILVANGFVKPILKLTEYMTYMAHGDLTKKLDVYSKDEIGQLGNSYNQTIHDLGALVQNVKSVSNELTMASQNLAATSEETSASADEVARTVDEIAKGASDQAHDAERSTVVARALSEKFVELAANTNKMLASAKSLMEANNTGVLAINTLKVKTESTNEANVRIQDVIGELNDKTKHIGTILDSISAISVQTNLLALNASIEAARAGEHGRGFAVVAEEIRKLAEQSSKAADEVRDIVVNIQADSTKTVETMSELQGIANEQNQAVGAVFNSFDQISTSYNEISSQIGCIGDSVSKLTSDKDAIVSSIENISAVSEETAAASQEVSASMSQQVMAVEEVARSAEKLNDISMDLNSEIGKFKL